MDQNMDGNGQNEKKEWSPQTNGQPADGASQDGQPSEAVNRQDILQGERVDLLDTVQTEEMVRQEQKSREMYQQDTTHRGTYPQNDQQDAAHRGMYPQNDQQDAAHRGTYPQNDQQDTVHRGTYPQYGASNGGAYQQYGGTYQQYGGNPQRTNRGIGFGIASMIMGIVSLILFCSCINIPVAIAAIIFGILYLVGNPESKVYGIVGIITAALSILFFGVMLLAIQGPIRHYSQDIERSIEQQIPGSGFEYDGDDFFDDDIFDDDFDMISPNSKGQEGKIVWQRFL